MQPSSNGFLRTLPRADLALLTPHLRQMAFGHGDVLGETGAAIRDAHFPESGMISVVVELSTGDRLEAALIGRDGMLGGAAAFGLRTYVNTAIGQMPGTCQTMNASELAAAAHKSDTLRAAVYRHEAFMLAQAQQTAACNAKHPIIARLATWLLRARDAAHTEDLTLTQEFLAQMLGVQRASISLVAASLQNDGVISYRRGHVRITDLRKLQSIACECHAAVRTQYERALGEKSLSKIASSD